MKRGDYVIATKYSDGDPQDHFAVGFFWEMTHHNRYIVVDDDCLPFRRNGFRKVKKISKEVGARIVQNITAIQGSRKSVWDFVKEFENEQL